VGTWLRAHWRSVAASVACLLVGVGIGVASMGDVQDDLDNTSAKLNDARRDLRQTNERLDTAERRSDRLEADNADLADKLRKATAKAPLPNFVGDTVVAAEQDIEDLGTHWDVVSQRQVSSAEPGTVIAQAPSEGTVLSRGRRITLTVAKEAPPSWKSIFAVSGSGSKRTDTFRIPSGAKVRVSYSFTGDTNAILSVVEPGDSEFGGDLLLNEIGDYSDTTRLYDKAGEYYLDIQGGSWTVDVQVFK
jgi:hypothetical protein